MSTEYEHQLLNLQNYVRTKTKPILLFKIFITFQYNN